MDAKEVLSRYAAGVRDFRQLDLKGISLVRANLSGADLTGTSLRGSDLSGANLSNTNLNWSSLKGANLNKTNLKGAKMPDGERHNDFLESANYLG